ncbi:MAG: hypothetical protein ACK5MV_10595 [Aminipila sp.]
MIIFENKCYQTNSLYPNTDWTNSAKYVVADDTPLSGKIITLYPNYDFVLDKNSNLVDVVEIQVPQSPQLTQSEQREQAYTSLTHKTDGTPLIVWESQPITVEQTNQKWLDYSAEGNVKANELSALIVSAKAYIRELYPD